MPPLSPPPPTPPQPPPGATGQSPVPNPTTTHTPSLRVLASGSSGNCTILRCADATLLIDAGLSPRRTRNHLADMGMTLDQLDGILLTHLDSDHFHPGWAKALPDNLPVYLHHTHKAEARRRGFTQGTYLPFRDILSPAPDLHIAAMLCDHDDTGTASFRFEFACGASLGFATDLGCVTDHLAEHLACVDVLAIESNYCPRLQALSDRPEFLKRRVTGGRGHLSNHETVSLIEDVSPRDHVVLLHLSRQCNDPTLVKRLHAEADYRLTITQPDQPTPWIRIEHAPPGSPQIVTTTPTSRKASNTPRTLFVPTPGT